MGVKQEKYRENKISPLTIICIVLSIIVSMILIYKTDRYLIVLRNLISPSEPDVYDVLEYIFTSPHLYVVFIFVILAIIIEKISRKIESMTKNNAGFRRRLEIIEEKVHELELFADSVYETQGDTTLKEKLKQKFNSIDGKDL